MKYMGSKLRIANDIAMYINNIAFCEKIEDYYEPFMGGCSVGEVITVKNRHLSDINEHIVALFEQVQKGMWPFEYIDRETWYKIKDDRFENKIYPKWITGWCSVACSFRGRCFEGYAGEYIDKTTGKVVNPQLQVYNSLCLERDKLLGVDFKVQKYKDIGDVKNSIIYCDAPYRNVKQYTMVDAFDFDEYDEWLLKMSENNLVLISEYSMNGKYRDRFKLLKSWQLNKSIGAGNTDDESSIENLYYVKGGYLTQYFENNDTDEDELDF